MPVRGKIKPHPFPNAVRWRDAEQCVENPRFMNIDEDKHRFWVWLINLGQPMKTRDPPEPSTRSAQPVNRLAHVVTACARHRQGHAWLHFDRRPVGWAPING